MEADRVLHEKLDISFILSRKVQFGEQVVIVGNHPLLGKWEVGASQGRMTWRQGDEWTAKVTFDSVDIVSKPLEYKFVVVKGGENANAEWESIPNRVLYVSRDYPGPIRVQWNTEQKVDQKYLELQAERKRTWLAQAEKLRALREADPDKNAPVANKPHILEEAAKLLELKQLDADWAVIFGPKTVKIRWQFADADGQEVRLQFPFPNRTSVSLAEVKKAIHDGMEGRYACGSLKKLEYKADKNAAGKLQWRQVSADEERFRLPLIFPGPLLKSSHSFVFRVEFELPPKLLNQRGKYLGYLEG